MSKRWLADLSVYNVRVLHEVKLEFSSGFNVVWGLNGSGKSSLLEAVHLLGTGNSFRSNDIKKLITTGESQLVVRGIITEENGQTTTSALLKDGSKTKIKIDHQHAYRSSDLAKQMPLRAMHPVNLNLFERGSTPLRQFMDWGVFHVEPEFHRVWSTYRQALKQRNFLLKSSRCHYQEVEPWDFQLSDLAGQLAQMRNDYLAALNTELEVLLIEGAENGEPASLKLSHGWPQDQPLHQVLKTQFSTDQKRGYTQQGPHRFRLRAMTGKSNVVDFYSRGQQKHLSCLLFVAQVKVLTHKELKKPIILVDDLLSELDPDRAKNILHLFSELGVQIIATAISATPLTEWLPNPSVFHVKHGSVFQTK